MDSPTLPMPEFLSTAADELGRAGEFPAYYKVAAALEASLTVECIGIFHLSPRIWRVSGRLVDQCVRDHCALGDNF